PTPLLWFHSLAREPLSRAGRSPTAPADVRFLRGLTRKVPQPTAARKRPGSPCAPASRSAHPSTPPGPTSLQLGTEPVRRNSRHAHGSAAAVAGLCRAHSSDGYPAQRCRLTGAGVSPSRPCAGFVDRFSPAGRLRGSGRVRPLAGPARYPPGRDDGPPAVGAAG